MSWVLAVGILGCCGVGSSCTPERTNLELSPGRAGRRSNPFSLDHGSHLEPRAVEPRGRMQNASASCRMVTYGAFFAVVSIGDRSAVEKQYHLRQLFTLYRGAIVTMPSIVLGGRYG